MRSYGDTKSTGSDWLRRTWMKSMEAKVIHSSLFTRNSPCSSLHCNHKTPSSSLSSNGRGSRRNESGTVDTWTNPNPNSNSNPRWPCWSHL